MIPITKLMHHGMCIIYLQKKSSRKGWFVCFVSIIKIKDYTNKETVPT